MIARFQIDRKKDVLAVKWVVGNGQTDTKYVSNLKFKIDFETPHKSFAQEILKN